MGPGVASEVSVMKQIVLIGGAPFGYPMSTECFLNTCENSLLVTNSAHLDWTGH